jgi:hypothetical protein
LRGQEVLKLPQVTVKSGRASEITQPERRAALEQLQARLASCGVTIDLEVAEYIPGRRGLTWVECVWIYVAGPASAALIANLVNDLYKQAKSWAIDRFRKKLEANPDGSPRPEWFTIYGPDGEPMKTFKIDKEGEHED